MATNINKTDLARRTRQIVDLVRRGHTVIVESYGEAQVAIMDILDYRLLRAVATYRATPPQPAPIRDETISPRGLKEEEVKQAIRDASGDEQAAWNRVMAVYLDGDISLGRAAQLLDLSRFELVERFNRLGIPLQLGPTSIEEARAEFEALR
ncbi:MAG: UPF0175 family protein [Candidatus Bipolaricaulia bacterium]